jgi:hypothetical protein
MNAAEQTQSTTTPWYGNHDDVVSFARVLVDAEWLDTSGEVIDYFERPWKWSPEYGVWIQAGRPTAAEGGVGVGVWDAFVRLLDQLAENPDRPPLVGL